MELNEAADRILHHRKLIIGMALAGALVAFLLHAGDPPTYSATTRFVLDSTDLSGQAVAGTVLADTASAIATSPAQVARALHSIALRRDPTTVARDHVKVQTLGTSGVLRLTVSDESPAVAASLANALTREVIEVTTHISNGRVSETLDRLAGQIESLTNRIDSADRRINGLSSEIAASADPSQTASLRAAQTDLAQVRNALAQSRGVLQSEQSNIVATDAARPEATVVQSATPPPSADPSGRLPDVALGTLLGLFLGIGAAALIEVLHPTVFGRSSMVREMGAPFLGELPVPPDQVMSTGVADVAFRVGLAASSRGIDHVQLVGVTGTPLDGFALLLKDGVRNQIWAEVEPSTTSPSSAPRRRAANGASGQEWNGRANFTVDVIGASPPPSRNSRNRVGLLLVVPMAAPRSQLSPIERVTEISGWPVIGVVGYPQAAEGRFRWRVPSTGRNSKANASQVGTGG